MVKCQVQSDHGFKTEYLWTELVSCLSHSKIKLVWFSDSHCIWQAKQKKFFFSFHRCCLPNLPDALRSLKKVFAAIFASKATKNVTPVFSDRKTPTRVVTKIANSELTLNAQTRIHPVVSVRNYDITQISASSSFILQYLKQKILL